MEWVVSNVFSSSTLVILPKFIVPAVAFGVFKLIFLLNDVSFTYLPESGFCIMAGIIGG
jgi:hypothetical protein